VAFVPSPSVEITSIRVQVSANPEFASPPHDAAITKGWQDEVVLRSQRRQVLASWPSSTLAWLLPPRQSRSKTSSQVLMFGPLRALHKFPFLFTGHCCSPTARNQVD